MRRKALFCLILFVGLYLVLEAFSFIGYRIAAGENFSFAKLAAKRQARLQAEDSTGLPAQLANFYNAPVFVHPYLGFVINRNFYRDAEIQRVYPGLSVSREGFIVDQSAPSVIQKKSPDKLIVGITGGSFAGGLAVMGAGELESTLAESGHLAGKRIVFVRLANGGYKQPQQLMTLAYLLGLGAQFDVIINVDGFNEVALSPFENLGAIPLDFPRSWHVTVRKAGGETEIRAAEAEAAALRLRQSRLAAWFARAPLRYSVTCNIIWSSLDARLENRVRAISRRFDSRDPEASSDAVVRFYRPEARPAPDRLYADLTGLWRDCSIQMGKLCVANKIAYFHFLQPNQYVPGSKTMGPEEKRIALSDRQPMRTSVLQGYPLLQQAGRELQRAEVQYQDLTMVFSRHPEPLYEDDCCHPNRQGYEIVARTIGLAVARTMAQAGASTPTDKGKALSEVPRGGR